MHPEWRASGTREPAGGPWTVDVGSCQMWPKLPPEICFHRFCLETQCGAWEQLGVSE